MVTSFNPRLTSAARRTEQKKTVSAKAVFQSAPHFSSEANADSAYMVSLIFPFQSAPHFSSEANSLRNHEFFYFHEVSIRASLQQRGEPTFQKKLFVSGGFQSAPHFSSEANILVCGVEAKSAGFNPRLTSAARRTANTVQGEDEPISFNPRLTSAARRTGAALTMWSIVLMFQSAPHFSSEANEYQR